MCAQLSVSSTQVTIPANAGGSHVITVQGATPGCPVQSINVVVTSGVEATHGSRGPSFTACTSPNCSRSPWALLGIGPAVNRAGHRRNRRSRHAAR